MHRISPRNRASSFLNSEFSVEDIGLFRVENLSYTFLGEVRVNNKVFYKFSAEPKYSHSGYAKLMIWLDQDKERVQRVDYYDLNAKLLKTQRFFEYKLYKDQYWRAHKVMMKNYQAKRETLLQWSDIQFDQNLSSKDFKKSALKRTL